VDAAAPLTALDFGSTMIERCSQPFLGRNFLGREPSTSSRKLGFVIRMLGEGEIAIPAAGMGAIW
jgi:hypothetical protein